MSFADLIEALRVATANASQFSASERDELMAASHRLQHRLTMVTPSGPLHRRPDPCLNLDPVAERMA